jgi:hypothetical protein
VALFVGGAGAPTVAFPLSPQMKRTPATRFAAIATIACVVVVGFAVGRLVAPGAGTAVAGGTAGAEQVRAGARSKELAGESAERATRARERAKEDPTKRKMADLERIVREDNAIERARELLAFIAKLNSAELKDAVASFRDLGLTQERMGEYSLLLAAWAEADPIEALAYARANTGGTFATNTILAAWAARDPEATLLWAQEHHRGEDANPHMARIIGVIAATDIKRASELTVGMPYSSERGEAFAAMAPHLAALGQDAARRWVDSLKDEVFRMGAMVRLNQELARIDPQGTAQWLADHPTSVSPSAAIDFLLSNPPVAQRKFAMRPSFSDAATEDWHGPATIVGAGAPEAPKRSMTVTILPPM